MKVIQKGKNLRMIELYSPHKLYQGIFRRITGLNHQHTLMADLDKFLHIYELLDQHRNFKHIFQRNNQLHYLQMLIQRNHKISRKFELNFVDKDY